MMQYWYFIIPSSIILLRVFIIEWCKIIRIGRLKGLDKSTIDAIGNYEKKASFWSKFKS